MILTSNLNQNPKSIESHISQLFDTALDSKTAELEISAESKDVDIISSITRGCRDNFKHLVTKYYNPIYHYILRSVNFHTETTQDLVSETFFKAYLSLNRFRSKGKFSSWLYRIAHNSIIDHYRSYKGPQKELDTVIDDSANKEIAQKLMSNDSMQGFNSDEILAPLLNSLTEKDRQLLILFYLEELPINEIAQIYNVFPGTIKTRLHRARKQAQKLVAQNTQCTQKRNGNFFDMMNEFLSNIQPHLNTQKPQS